LGDGGLGIGHWDLGIGDWPQSPIPNPQSPIPNPQSPLNIYSTNNLLSQKNILKMLNKNIYKYIYFIKSKYVYS